MAAEMARLLSDTLVESSVDLHELLSDSFEFDDDADLDSRDSPSSPLSSALSSLDATPRHRAAVPKAPPPAPPPPPNTLAAENLALRRAVEASEARAFAERQAYRVAIEAERARTRAQLEELRAAAAAVAAELPAARSRLAAEKAAFAELRLSAARYDELRRLPPEAVGVVEFVQLRVYEELLREREAEAAAARGAAARAEAAAARLDAVAAAKDALEARVGEAAARSAAWQAEAEAAKAEARRVAEEAAAFSASPEGVVRARLLEAEALLDAARRREEAKEAEAAARGAEVAALRDRLAEASSKLSFLEQDKAYLTRQAADMSDRAADAEARLAKKEGKVAELKAALSAAHEKQLSHTSDQAESYTLKLEAEMAKWEQHSARALRAAEANFEAQLRQQKEAYEVATAEAEKWQHRYDEAKKLADEHLLRAAETSATLEVQVAQLRSEVRIKAFEVERLTAQCEQTSAGSRRGELETDAWREKLEECPLSIPSRCLSSPILPLPLLLPHVLKTEYYKLKAATAERIAQLDTQNAGLHERLKAYEKLEEELDKTVLQTVASDVFGGGATAASAAGSSQPMIRVPSSSQRRMEQCLSLARELLAAQNSADALQVEQSQLTAEVQALKAQLADAQRLVRMTAQPQSYLVEQMHLSEQRQRAAEAQLSALARERAEQESALVAMRQQNLMLRGDLERMIAQRGTLDELRAALARVLGPQPAVPRPST
ncbi:hypothetical protein AB1Y20_012314 [Prymnesium parvum]|uniref:Centrosomal protein of 162 kDa n=1 Tax=Prymnesium parvum TaxID=97485 RepID=A0AB34IPC9_PRYPA